MEPIIGIHPLERGMVLILPIGIRSAAPVHPVPMQPGFWVHVGFVCLRGGIQIGVDRLDGFDGVDPFQAMLVHELRGSCLAFLPHLLPFHFSPLRCRVERAFIVVDEALVYHLDERVGASDLRQNSNDLVAVYPVVIVDVDGLKPVILVEINAQSGIIHDSGLPLANAVDVMVQPLDDLQSGHRSVGLPSGREPFITIIWTPLVTADELRIAHEGDDAVNRRLNPWAGVAVKRGWRGIDHRGDCTDFNRLWTIGDSNYDGSGGVDVGGGGGVGGVHCLDPRCPAQGATLRNLGQKPYLPIYTLRQQ